MDQNQQNQELLAFCQNPQWNWETHNSFDYVNDERNKLRNFYAWNLSEAHKEGSFYIYLWQNSAPHDSFPRGYWDLRCSCRSSLDVEKMISALSVSSPKNPILALQKKDDSPIAPMPRKSNKCHDFFGWYQFSGVWGDLPLEACWIPELIKEYKTQQTKKTSLK